MVETQRWELGYEAGLMILNKNAYDLLNWKLSFSYLGGGNFTWGPSDVDITWTGTHVSAVCAGCWLAGWLAGSLGAAAVAAAFWQRYARHGSGWAGE